MGEQVRIVGAVAGNRAQPAGSGDPLPVEGEPPAAGERREGAGRELVAPESAGVDPVAASERRAEPAVDIGEVPGSAERRDLDLALVAQVTELEDRRLLGRVPDDREAGCVERAEERPVLRAHRVTISARSPSSASARAA